jgi:hypothetical protein
MVWISDCSRSSEKGLNSGVCFEVNAGRIYPQIGCGALEVYSCPLVRFGKLKRKV